MAGLRVILAKVTVAGGKVLPGSPLRGALFLDPERGVSKEVMPLALLHCELLVCRNPAETPSSPSLESCNSNFWLRRT